MNNGIPNYENFKIKWLLVYETSFGYGHKVKIYEIKEPILKSFEGKY